MALQQDLKMIFKTLGEILQEPGALSNEQIHGSKKTGGKLEAKYFAFLLTLVNFKNKKISFIDPFALWCNGSTTGSGPVSLGSNPSGAVVRCAKTPDRVFTCSLFNAANYPEQAR